MSVEGLRLADLPPDQRTSMLDAAIVCAMASQLAYEDGEPLAQASATADLELKQRMTHASNFGAIFDHGDMRVVAFRGTDGRRDWLTSLNLLWRISPWGPVHRGFWDAAASFHSEVDASVREAKGSGRRVWVTGHSLGGAIAVLTAARLSASSPSLVDGLCTFGQPPVAGLLFGRRCTETLGGRYLRLVNHTDAVVEASTLLAAHCGWLWYFDAEGRLHHDRPFKVALADRWKANRSLGGLYMFAAHGLDGYRQPLHALRCAIR
jgi:triacylglycerol lipase